LWFILRTPNWSEWTNSHQCTIECEACYDCCRWIPTELMLGFTVVTCYVHWIGHLSRG
jgi:hypothetical protein